jgi:hypothetical protein
MTIKSINKVNNSALNLESNPRKILLYIVYGDDQVYYDGAIFSFLTFSYWLVNSSATETYILTEHPEKFLGYPVTVLKINKKQKKDWSLNGQYHFRIKNRGLAYIFDKLNLSEVDKVLFLDTDTYFKKSPMSLFELIKSNQALLYKNEGLIYEKKRFQSFVEKLDGKKIRVNNTIYSLSNKSSMWGSLMIGIGGNMRPYLDEADKLMLNFFDKDISHTIEQFSLSETLIKKFKIVEGKNFVNMYSSSGKKEYAEKVLVQFFNQNCDTKFSDKVRLSQNVKIKRPFFIVLKRYFLKLFKY